MKFDLTQQKGGFSLAASGQFPATGITVIAGPSGAGKTSLLRALVGLERAQGVVSLNGAVLQDHQHIVPVHKRHIAWVSQHDDVFAHMNVRQNLEFAQCFAPRFTQRFAPRFTPPRGHGPALDDIARRFGLAHSLTQNAGALSGGEKQRLVLARALCANPRLLALDEPFSALDIEARNALLHLLCKVCHALALPAVFVSHDLDTLTRLADFMVYMRGGEIITSEPLNAGLLDTRLPFRYRDDASVIVHAIAQHHDADMQLNHMDMDGVSLQVPGSAIKPGALVRLRLRAGDISLSHSRHEDSSVLNIVSVMVRAIEAAADGGLSPGLVNIDLALGKQMILARITEKSAQALKLSPGDKVFAQIKASALASG